MKTAAVSRRKFLRALGVTVAAAGSSAGSAGPAVKPVKTARRAGARRPNVLVVMSDQHRADFMGCAGHPALRTPGLDRMAREGVRLENAYCGFPLCCPSRMSFLSGRMPSEIECNDNVAQLGSDVPTLAHGFATAGYETVLSGRMHIIGFDQRHGFSQRIMPDVPGTAFFNAGSWGRRILGPLGPAAGGSRQSLLMSGPGKMGFHTFDEEVIGRTVGWLTSWSRRPTGDRNPFFLVAGLILPHPPFVGLLADFQALKDRFGPEDLPDPRIETLHPLHRAIRDHKEFSNETVTPGVRLRTLASYGANCLFIDRQIQRILAALDEHDLARDTIVVYISDHGEQMGAHGLWGKNVFYQESMRVPLLMRWPGNLPAGRTVSRCVSLVDLGSTLLQLAGLDPLPRAQSGFAPVLHGGDSGGSEDGVVIEGVISGVPARTLRRGKWRYSCYHGHGEELYNLETDPGEFRNLAADPDHRGIRDELEAKTRHGWDPERLANQIRLRAGELGLIRSWIEASELIEPDLPWHLNCDLVNFVNSG